MRAVLIALLLTTPGLVGPAGSAVPAKHPSYGVWHNPANSVHVAAKPCGDKMCGVVVWANAKAKADAAKGGNPKLVGMDLFQNFTQIDDTHWKGKVYVPDINKTFSGTVTVVNAHTLTGKVCLLGGLGCKSQTWTRVK